MAQRIFVAYLIQDELANLACEQIIAEFARQNTEIKTPLKIVDGPNGSLFATLGENSVCILQRPGAIPNVDMSVGIAHATDWPGARAALARQKASLSVQHWLQTGQKMEDVNPSVAACFVMQVASVLTALTPCIGVFWLTSSVLAKPEKFRAQTRYWAQALPPVEILVLLQLRKEHEKQKSGGFFSRFSSAGKKTIGGAHELIGAWTMGLYVFADRDIELAPAHLQPQRAAQVMIGACAHLIQHGPVRRNDTIISQSASERLTIRFARSAKTNDEIYLLVYENMG